MFKTFIEDQSLKAQTLKSVYNLIRQYGPISKVELLEKTKLSQTTLSRYVDELLKKEFILEYGLGESSGGRPPVLYRVNPTCCFLIGVEISRVEIKILLLDLQLQIVDSSIFPMTSKHSPELTIRQMKREIQRLLDQNHLKCEHLLGIGIGSVGPIDRKQGKILETESFPAEGWQHVPIVSELTNAFSVEVQLENGVNTAALAEYFACSSSSSNILYCHSGVGLRCGVVANGKLVGSKTGNASAYGHMVIEVNGKECTCGNRGCLSTYISFEAIRNILDAKNTTGYIDLEFIDDVVYSFKQGDPKVRQVVMETARFYGIGLANLVNTIQPDRIILSGILVYQLPEYYEEVVRTALQYICTLNFERIRFNQGVLQTDAAAIGGAILVLNNMFATTASEVPM